MQRRRSWKYASNSRVGARNARQYTGEGDDTFTLQGMIATGVLGSPISMDLLAEMASTGDAYVLVDGRGVVYGAYEIDELNETHSYFTILGVPQKIEFTLTITRVDDRALAASVDGGSATSEPTNGSLDKASPGATPPYVKPKKPKAKKG
ncbi:oxidoreductase [Burkholderia dolosa PC543]|nr:oxidoreductase [Burkholderia dolosa PC543]